MKKFISICKKNIFVSLLFLQFFLVASAQEGRHILKQGFTVDFFKEQIQEPADWVLYRGINKLMAWNYILNPAQLMAWAVKNNDPFQKHLIN
jgi:hypothetical protein